MINKKFATILMFFGFVFIFYSFSRNDHSKTLSKNVISNTSIKHVKDDNLLSFNFKKKSLKSNLINHQVKNKLNRKVPKYKSILANQVVELQNCLEVTCTEFSQFKDEKLGYHYAISLTVKKNAELYLNRYITRSELVERSELIEITEALLQFPEDLVREVGLDFVNQFELSHIDLIDNVIESLNYSISDSLYLKGLNVLKNLNYEFKQDEKINNFLLDKLLKGSESVSVKIAEKSLLFLNFKNLNQYKNVLSQINPNRKLYSELKSTIEEYEYFNSL